MSGSDTHDVAEPGDELLTFRTLYDSPMIEVRDYICRHTACGQSDEEESTVNGVVLMRHGAFTKHFGKRQVTADVNQSAFFTKDSVYRVSHPADCGDRGTTFVVAQRILNDIVRELDPKLPQDGVHDLSGGSLDMNFARANHVMLGLPDGTVVAIGGQLEPGRSVSPGAEVFVVPDGP